MRRRRRARWRARRRRCRPNPTPNPNPNPNPNTNTNHNPNPNPDQVKHWRAADGARRALEEATRLAEATRWARQEAAGRAAQEAAEAEKAERAQAQAERAEERAEEMTQAQVKKARKEEAAEEAAATKLGHQAYRARQEAALLSSKAALQQAQTEKLTLRLGKNGKDYLGVYFAKPGQPKPYEAKMRMVRGGKPKCLGHFATAEDAALFIARTLSIAAAEEGGAIHAAMVSPLG